MCSQICIVSCKPQLWHSPFLETAPHPSFNLVFTVDGMASAGFWNCSGGTQNDDVKTGNVTAKRKMVAANGPGVCHLQDSYPQLHDDH